MRFPTFHRITNSPTKPGWHRRETALLWGAPLVLFSALAIVPVTISLVLEPAFSHARLLGCVLIPVMGASMAYGLSRLAICFRRDMDVLTLFAGGTVIVFIVICMCSGVILASEVGTL